MVNLAGTGHPDTGPFENRKKNCRYHFISSFLKSTVQIPHVFEIQRNKFFLKKVTIKISPMK
jgi:hypothetical protein